ncbi:phage integrase SAM-like domain-containing protein [Aquimarina celericrescens]|uniref:Phage integrase SAM-like domain-containing protein n=1 Tax=Aquimarina celericrescens TaxID=1964542 RepID=A0ABW5AVB5_9FLAO|nr:site-specific integrase [Aquimarina celericrescens]
MASITLMLDKRNKTAKKFPLVIRIYHKRIPKNIQLGYKLESSQWNEKAKQIKSPFPNSKRANHDISSKMTVASGIISEYSTTLKDLTAYEIADLIEAALKKKNNEKSINNDRVLNRGGTYLELYSKKIINRYYNAKRFGTADALHNAVVFIKKYTGGNDILLSEINELFLEDLESHYLGQGNSLNGLGVHLRSIRRIYNLAIKDSQTELTLEHYPFGKNGYSIKQQRTKKKAVSLEVIKDIEVLKYPKDSALWHHKNYFLVNFYMRGMNFMDMAYLSVDAINNGRLQYKRRKTKRGNNVKEFDILIPEKVKPIFDHYCKNKSREDLVFPILEDVMKTESEDRVYEVYKNRRRNHIRRLGTIGKNVGLETKLTSYVARHTFATAGLHKGIFKAQIGDMLGHTNYYTTESYFADFENVVLDEAANKIFS